MLKLQHSFFGCFNLLILKVFERPEDFLDLSLDVEHNTSLFYCLKTLGKVDQLRGDN